MLPVPALSCVTVGVGSELGWALGDAGPSEGCATDELGSTLVVPSLFDAAGWSVDAGRLELWFGDDTLACASFDADGVAMRDVPEGDVLALA